MGDANTEANQATSQAGQKQRPPAKYDFSVDSIIQRLLEDRPLDSVSRSLMTLKLDQLKKAEKQHDIQQEKNSLWNFCDAQF